MRASALAQVAAAVCALLPGCVPALSADTKSSVMNSSHDLSITGPGPVTSGESDACIFCHTPHTSLVDTKPLWNHTLPIRTYNTYTSTTYDAGPAVPLAGVSKVCLSCHDGTIALGQTVSEGLIPTSGSMNPDSVLQTNLANDHPFAMQPADDGQLATSLFQNPPVSKDPAVELPSGRVECTSCHEPHSEDNDPIAGKFLVRSNSGGAVCLACHEPARPQPNRLNGWTSGAHATAPNSVPVTNFFGPYGTVIANACTNCHRQHTAAGPPRLLRFAEEADCDSCHSGANVSPPLRNVVGEFSSKTFSHPTTTVFGQHDPAEDVAPVGSARHAECADCHNPHGARAGAGSAPPAVDGPLLGASGFDGAGPIQSASNEYQICFKCHADSTNKPQNGSYAVYGRTPARVSNSQVIDPFNLRLKFNSAVGRHNVSNPRWRTGFDVPSLRSNMLNLNGASGRPMGTHLYCTDCHNNNQNRKFGGGGPNGPHGSNYPHLLERRYDQEAPPFGGVPYFSGMNGSAGICHKCHDIDNSILRDDSFTEHDEHIRGEDTSCSTCHDPHGIRGGNSVNNFAMIDFDTAIVSPSSSGILRFEHTGPRRGTCYLTCHGEDHNPENYGN